MTDFGLLLKTLRTNSNITQKELSALINISDKVISKWERIESFPDILSIRNLSHVLHISCDELLHPTETLTKMCEPIANSTPDVDESIETTEKPATDMYIEDTPPPSKQSIFTSKKLLLICIPILILTISLGIIGIKTIYFSEPYKLIETRNNVSTRKGNAYEIILVLNSKLGREDLMIYSDYIAHEWRSGAYPDSTEDVLVISFYLSDMYASLETLVYFQSTHIRHPIPE